MSKSSKKRPTAPPISRGPAVKLASQTANGPSDKAASSRSKQSNLIAMLQSPPGATISAMMKATGWQQHSVRGFLAGVVRKRLKLNLSSKKADGDRIYQIASAGNREIASARSKRRSS